jgi:hypothetical protein
MVAPFASGVPVKVEGNPHVPLLPPAWPYPWELERFLYLLVMLTILTGVIIVIRTDSVPSYSIVILVEI